MGSTRRRRSATRKSTLHRLKVPDGSALELSRFVRDRYLDSDNYQTREFTHRGITGLLITGGVLLRDEKEALVHDIATATGVPSQKAAPIRSIRDKITKCINSGWLTAPISDTVQQLMALDGHAFRRCLIEDASRQNARDHW